MEVNMKMVAALIAKDLHILQQQLADTMDMSKMSIHQIVLVLGMRRTSAG